MSWGRKSVLSFPIPPAARASMATMLRATVCKGLGSKACDPSSNAPRANSACSSKKFAPAPGHEFNFETSGKQGPGGQDGQTWRESVFVFPPADACPHAQTPGLVPQKGKLKRTNKICRAIFESPSTPQASKSKTIPPTSNGILLKCPSKLIVSRSRVNKNCKN